MEVVSRSTRDASRRRGQQKQTEKNEKQQEQQGEENECTLLLMLLPIIRNAIDREIDSSCQKSGYSNEIGFQNDYPKRMDTLWVIHEVRQLMARIFADQC